MFEVQFFAEAIDKYKKADEAHDNNPEGELSGGTWEAREITLKDLRDTFRDAVKAVLFNE